MWESGSSTDERHIHAESSLTTLYSSATPVSVSFTEPVTSPVSYQCSRMESMRPSLIDREEELWRKVLYERQPFPDNYVDPHTFLGGRMKNLYINNNSSFTRLQYEDEDNNIDIDSNLKFHQLRFWPVFVSASVVVKEFTLVCIFLGISKHITHYEQGEESNRGSCFKALMLLDFTLIVLGYLLHFRLAPSSNSIESIPIVTWQDVLRSCFIMGSLLRIFAPLLQSLTAPYSQDTIHALTIFFSALHLVFFDYSFIRGERDTYSGVLSLNASMVTAIMLVSRFYDILTVCAFMLLAVLLFVFSPWTFRLVRGLSIFGDLIITCILCILGGIVLWFPEEQVLLIIYICILLFVWAICPLWLTSMHKYKKVKALYQGNW
jgi:phosphatidylinositol N-acetylglucosaminyltransferase subunit C